MENFKYFKNSSCEYFPCHNLSDNNSFNCLFCYCPLYALKDKCGGNFKYINDIKDCSNCTIPHGKKGYDYIMSKTLDIIELGKKQND